MSSQTPVCHPQTACAPMGSIRELLHEIDFQNRTARISDCTLRIHDRHISVLDCDRDHVIGFYDTPPQLDQPMGPIENVHVSDRQVSITMQSGATVVAHFSDVLTFRLHDPDWSEIVQFIG